MNRRWHREIAVVKGENADLTAGGKHPAQRICHRCCQTVFTIPGKADFTALCIERAADSLLQRNDRTVFHQ
ncbi:hypothetical protein SDC9_142091 [bioreactor metagenome]|uniref:Uncharacterized protein n=1 Tax=bioreactor metagenome TaxID=1076179 RepID=A0A645E301_9ZZZZ